MEPHAIIPLIYNPKAFLLFGDKNVKPKDRLNLEQMYQNENLTQSLFQRLLNNHNMKIVLNVMHQHRFPSELNSLFAETIWNNSNNNNDVHCVASINENFPLKCFHVFNRTDDSYMEDLTREIVSFNNYQYSVGIILPPNRL